jgi:hypothetical protein
MTSSRIALRHHVAFLPLTAKSSSGEIGSSEATARGCGFGRLHRPRVALTLVNARVCWAHQHGRQEQLGRVQ